MSDNPDSSHPQTTRTTVEFDQYADDYCVLLKDPIRDLFANTPGFFFEQKMKLLLNVLRSIGRDPSGMSWLDLGCGRGEMLRVGRKYFTEALGCDPSASMLNACADLAVHIQPNASGVPFDNDRFDFVSAVCVYHHLDLIKREELTREAARVLKTGGIFLVVEHNPYNPITRLIVSRTPVDVRAKLISARGIRKLMSDNQLRPFATHYFLYVPERFLPRYSWVESGLTRFPLGGQYTVFALKGHGQ
jgi:SAM-dependent methyltransferase